jgi:hypothetical protein
VRIAAFLFVVGCGNTTDVPEFDLHIEAVWVAADAPEITSVAVDGQPLVAGQPYVVDDEFASFLDASNSFAPRSVVVTTATDSTSSIFGMSTCGQLDQVTLKGLGRLIGENDNYLIGDPSHQVAWESGKCVGVDGGIAAIQRVQTK